MTLKEELEILRGEPIAVCTGNPLDIPCIETSDSEKLCKHPIVSVNMITYNHEPYIREAIEGVMMQQTDFEFELVIGEDASTDRTREICFEYQKRYPDKIRVLWWHENLRKVNHPAGCNGARTRAHCRGEFIALCEGDDYWIDPLKLQKQVDAMRKFPSVGYCVTDSLVKCEVPRNHPRLKNFVIREWRDDDTFVFDMGAYKPGFVPKDEFWKNRIYYPRTATVMYRVSDLNEARKTLEILNWKMKIGDVLLWNALPFVSDAYYIPDITAVYRLNAGGASFSIQKKELRKNAYFELDIIEYYFDAVKKEYPAATYKKCAVLTKRIEYLASSKCGLSGIIKLLEHSVFTDAVKMRRFYWMIYKILIRMGIRIQPSSFDRWVCLARMPVTILKKLYRRSGK